MFVRVLVLFFVAVMAGCAAVQPLPQAARAGDTVTLYVGTGDGLDASDVTVSYVPDSDPANPVDMTANVRSVFKLYPDRTSRLWLQEVGVLEPRVNHGAWMNVLVVDLPASLPVGTGAVRVTTAPGVVFPNNAKPVDDIGIGLEILPGQGSRNPFAYVRYTWSRAEPLGLKTLEPQPQVLVSIPSNGDYADGGRYGAIEIKVVAPVTDGQGARAPDSAIRVVADDQLSAINAMTQMMWSRSGDEFTVRFISPSSQLPDYGARFSIVPQADAGWSFSQPPYITSVRYFDRDGYETTGRAPRAEMRP